MKINFVPKEAIWPLFGKYHYDTELIEIRNDLPRFVKAYVLVHEFLHEDDRRDNEGLIHRESESHFGSVFYVFIGSLWVMVASLSKARLKLIWERLRRET